MKISKIDPVGIIVKDLSAELKDAPWGGCEPATIIKDNVFEKINKFKEQSGKDIVIWEVRRSHIHLCKKDSVTKFSCE